METFIEIINSTFYDFKTHTSNNSTELTDYEEIAAITDGDFYFARSYRSNDRGLNKHNNDLIMRFLSKERDSNEVSNEEIVKIKNILNIRDRESLGYSSLNDVFLEYWRADLDIIPM
ncbi:hypothetical protein [Candidatus Enterovibrio escicola]|uniref:hypothetical protein n=1 Tax=Candidatus Enterovibrio escicola TaxID=1927127 RepID=UPI0016805411|nr:hypothetical protein [Candidatus Enterovibrio escacola]